MFGRLRAIYEVLAWDNVEVPYYPSVQTYSYNRGEAKKCARALANNYVLVKVKAMSAQEGGRERVVVTWRNGKNY